MSQEQRGWGVERDKPRKTKTGLVLYKKRDGNWAINFPDGKKFYNVTFPELIYLLAYLAEGKSLQDARRKAGWD